MIGTSDQSCWLAEACKILLLLVASQISQSQHGNRYTPWGRRGKFRASGQTTVACLFKAKVSTNAVYSFIACCDLSSSFMTPPKSIS